MANPRHGGVPSNTLDVVHCRHSKTVEIVSESNLGERYDQGVYAQREGTCVSGVSMSVTESGLCLALADLLHDLAEMAYRSNPTSSLSSHDLLPSA